MFYWLNYNYSFFALNLDLFGINVLFKKESSKVSYTWGIGIFFLCLGTTSLPIKSFWTKL
jgi:hypothetical protein